MSTIEKIRTARMVAGTRILVTTDRSKRAAGDDTGTAYYSRVLTGAITATVTATGVMAEQDGAATRRYWVETDAGRIEGLTGQQTARVAAAPAAPVTGGSTVVVDAVQVAHVRHIDATAPADPWAALDADATPAAPVEQVADAPAGDPVPEVHTFATSAEALAACESTGGVGVGDVLVIAAERVVGFVSPFGPVAITARAGALPKTDRDPRAMDAGAWSPSLALADRWAEALRIDLAWKPAPSVAAIDRAQAVAITLLDVPEKPGPADYDPYRAQIRDCECLDCIELSYSRSNDFDGSERRAAARTLLAVLRAGLHVRRERAEHIADAKREHAERVAIYKAVGACPAKLDVVERGYAKAPTTDFMRGGGLGMSFKVPQTAAMDRIDRHEALGTDPATWTGTENGWHGPVLDGAARVIAWSDGVGHRHGDQAADAPAPAPAAPSAPVAADETPEHNDNDECAKYNEDDTVLTDQGDSGIYAGELQVGDVFRDALDDGWWIAEDITRVSGVVHIVTAPGGGQDDETGDTDETAGDGPDADPWASLTGEAPAPASEPLDAAADRVPVDEASPYQQQPEMYLPVLDSDDGAALTITHTHADGTRFDGGAKGDGTWEILRGVGFEYRGNVGIYMPHTRDRFADLDAIDKAARALRAAGHLVAVEVDDMWRPAAVREEHRAERAEYREEMTAWRARRAAARSDAAEQARRKIADGIPMGQPLLVDHHSYGRSLRDVRRMEALDRKRFAEADYARTLADRAAGARANEDAKHGSRAIMDRIDRLTADMRRWMRSVAESESADWTRRARLEAEKLAEDIDYQRVKLAARATSGEFVAWSREHFEPGDLARVAGAWLTVARANAKSLSVHGKYQWSTKPETVKWSDVHGRRRDGVQLDMPGAEPWPVADADRVELWERVNANADRANADADQARRVRQTRAILAGLAVTATEPEVAAHAGPEDKAGQRTAAILAADIYRALRGTSETPGQKPEQVAATFADRVAAVRAMSPAPLWKMPAGEPVDRRIDQLTPGDIIAGMWDNGMGGRRLYTSFSGPVASVSAPNNRRESGVWHTVKLTNGLEATHKSHIWYAVHPASGGGDTTPAPETTPTPEHGPTKEEHTTAIRAAGYAAKFAAETVTAEPPVYVEPTDEALRAAFANCARVPDADTLAGIRAAFVQAYAAQIEAARADVEHQTRTTVRRSDGAERYVTKSNGSAGRFVVDENAWAHCSCGWKAAAADREEARSLARGHRRDNTPATEHPAGCNCRPCYERVTADVAAETSAPTGPQHADRAVYFWCSGGCGRFVLGRPGRLPHLVAVDAHQDSADSAPCCMDEISAAHPSYVAAVEAQRVADGRDDTEDGLNAVRDALTAGQVQQCGREFTLPEMDRELWTRAHAVILAMGATGGARKGQSYRSGRDLRPALTAFILGGPAPVPAKKAEGWVPTPDALAAEIVFKHGLLGALPTGGVVVEPSAGEGALVTAILDQRPDVTVHAVEPDAHRAETLRDRFPDVSAAIPGTGRTHVHAETFEVFASKYDGPRPALVLMNPPYSVSGSDAIWADHMRLAWDMLVPGGRLVAIVPNSYRTRGGAPAIVRQLLGDAAEVTDLPADAFKQSGVGIRTVVVAATKPGGDPDVIRQAWRERYERHLFDSDAPIDATRAVDRGDGELVTDRAAADTAPVQRIRGWGSEVYAYRADCLICERPVWSADGGDGIGAAGEAGAGFSPHPEWDMVGPAVALCVADGQIAEHVKAAEAIGRLVWAAGPAEPEAAGEADGWEDIV